MTTQNTTLSQFITTRDGHLDDEYNDQLDQELKRRALQEAGKGVLLGVLRGAKTGLVALLDATDELIASGR